jgi:hypothetical protein
MWKIGMALSACVALVCGVLLWGGQSTASSSSAEPQKLDVKKFKKIINKIDPEIKAAQLQLVAARKALEAAKAKITAAMNDEIFGEKGATEGAVIDQLKHSLNSTNKSLADVNAAIKAANKAQFLDKGGD